MYLATILLLMLIIPAVAVATDGSQADLMDLVGKYFVFWAVGVRLFTAGVRQIWKPGLTSEGILGIKGRDSWVLVRELGFANTAIGAVALVSLWHAEWRTAGALAGAVFLLLAGAQHVLKRERNRDETVAMVSDLAIGMLMVAYLLSR